jgi:hypothetical protein
MTKIQRIQRSNGKRSRTFVENGNTGEILWRTY